MQHRADGIAYFKAPRTTSAYLWDTTIVMPKPDGPESHPSKNLNGEIAAPRAEKGKISHYAKNYDLDSSKVILQPIALDIYGAMGPSTAAFVSNLASFAYPSTVSIDAQGNSILIPHPYRPVFLKHNRQALAAAAAAGLPSKGIWISFPVGNPLPATS